MERLVRDLARKSGKQVTLVTEGEETEIDRTMVDGITDPLVHMIRNAVDHGIGAPDARKQAGKPPTGTIRLKAAHIGGHVVVSIQDDGRGLDRERIVEKALSKGVIPTAEGLTERQAFDLIFAPGFSTAETVTDVSGRGVGMDVVKRNITGIGGHIEIASAAGQGSTFSMHIPLTLAITDGMLVHVGEQRYIIPTRSISLTFRPEASALTLVADQGELVRFRDHMLPLVRLHRLFEIPGAVEKAEEGLLVVVEDSVQNYALLVDGLLGQQQVVTKPLGAGIGQALGLAGAAILGDGRVGLILDSAGIAALSRDTDFDVLAAAA
jgi:two-component system chemotaxis sensor kinase CheA